MLLKTASSALLFLWVTGSGWDGGNISVHLFDYRRYFLLWRLESDAPYWFGSCKSDHRRQPGGSRVRLFCNVSPKSACDYVLKGRFVSLFFRWISTWCRDLYGRHTRSTSCVRSCYFNCYYLCVCAGFYLVFYSLIMQLFVCHLWQKAPAIWLQSNSVWQTDGGEQLKVCSGHGFWLICSAC